MVGRGGGGLAGGGGGVTTTAAAPASASSRRKFHATPSLSSSSWSSALSLSSLQLQQQLELHHMRRPMSSSSSNNKDLYNFKLYNTNLAITRDIPNSIVHDGLTKYSNHLDGIDLIKARQQHEYYVQTLQTLLPNNVNVIQLPTIEEYPDCVFVEDTCFVIKTCNNNDNDSNSNTDTDTDTGTDSNDTTITVILTNPGHVSRRGEVDSMKDLFVNDILPNYHRYTRNNDGSTSTSSTTTIHLYDMRDYNNSNDDNDDIIYCDGGDVLYTGRHLFVGISERTNHAAVQYLQSIFHTTNTANTITTTTNDNDMPRQPLPTLTTTSTSTSTTSTSTTSSPTAVLHKNIPNVPVIPVTLPTNNTEALHLKSIVTHIDECTLLVPTGQLGDDILRSMFSNFCDDYGNYDGYEIIRVPNLLACNVVSVSVVNNNDGSTKTTRTTILAQDGGCDESKRILEDVAKKKNLTLIWTDNSELAKVDAALTCCSILL